MKRLIFLSILFFGSITICFSQSNKEQIEIAVSNFSNQFNNKEYNAIFNSFSEKMQKAAPLNKLLSFLKGVKKQKGDILKSTYYDYRLGWTSYKTYFEKDSAFLKLALNKNLKISGFQITSITKKKDLKKITNSHNANMILPFNGTWFVTWGGDTPEENYHVKNKAQKNAFDFLIKDNDGNTFKNKGKTNEDYYAFGKNIIAPIKGKVIMVIDGIPDNKPGTMNPIFLLGNSIVLQTKDNEYLFFAHFKKHSIKVKEGDIIKQGDLLGLCGNSGNSSEPHLHFHIQNTDNMMTGTGIKSYFKDIVVNQILKSNYSPVRGELIKNK